MHIECPYCHAKNIQGDDRCVECFHSLMQRNLPKAKVTDVIQNIMMTNPISDLITGKDLLVASPTDSIQKIVRILQKENKNCILIYKKHHLVGIISNRDILHRVVGKYKDLSKIKAEDIMTKNPEYVTGDSPIAFVINKMAMGGYRHVPVLQEDGAPLSIIIIKDVLGYLAKRKKSA